MFKNYFVVTFRNLRKNSIYSFINIAGLSLGITCSLLITLWVYDELSFDLFHPKADRIYQVRNAEYDGKINSWTVTPLPTYHALRSENSNIVAAAITDWGGDHLLTVGDNSIKKRGFFASERKVLGASVTSLVSLISGEFSKLVVIALWCQHQRRGGYSINSWNSTNTGLKLRGGCFHLQA
jgi:hypothetical protein